MEERKLRLVENPPIVKVENLNKTFGSVQALREMSIWRFPRAGSSACWGPTAAARRPC